MKRSCEKEAELYLETSSIDSGYALHYNRVPHGSALGSSPSFWGKSTVVKNTGGTKQGWNVTCSSLLTNCDSQSQLPHLQGWSGSQHQQQLEEENNAQSAWWWLWLWKAMLHTVAGPRETHRESSMEQHSTLVGSNSGSVIISKVHCFPPTYMGPLTPGNGRRGSKAWVSVVADLMPTERHRGGNLPVQQTGLESPCSSDHQNRAATSHSPPVPSGWVSS
jgi:hypothetical protein